MRKYVKIAVLVLVALIFVGTFVFLYQKSQPQDTVFHLTDPFSPLLDFIPQSQQSDKIPLPTVHNNV